MSSIIYRGHSQKLPREHVMQTNKNILSHRNTEDVLKYYYILHLKLDRLNFQQEKSVYISCYHAYLSTNMNLIIF